MTFSKIFENIGSRAIGLQFDIAVLSPFLYIGIISEYFKRLRNTLVDKDLLIIYVNGDDINIALAFINLMLIPSYPLAGLSLIVLITSTISLQLIFFNIKL
jgi:hypothetical protein